MEHKCPDCKKVIVNINNKYGICKIYKCKNKNCHKTYGKFTSTNGLKH